MPKKPEPNLSFSSPLVEYESFIDGDNLLTFIKWCEHEYKAKPGNVTFDEAYIIILRAKDVNGLRRAGRASDDPKPESRAA